MKKSELRQIIKELIREEYKPPINYAKGPLICDPTQWSDFGTWKDNWMRSSNFLVGSDTSNQPCNMICNKIEIWNQKITIEKDTNMLNQLACKLDVGTNASSIYKCGC
tara:strand:- start:763 stop:1086 length:324 start_codon:yes stop_codon:yes gene_type:complete